MYAPLYLSNECQNICTYCGFSLDNKIKRKTLSDAEIKLEIEALKNTGFDHVLLVTGEANYTVNINYFLNAIALIREQFSIISVEVQPLSTEEYQRYMKLAFIRFWYIRKRTIRKFTKNTIPKAKNQISIIDWKLRTELELPESTK